MPALVSAAMTDTAQQEQQGGGRKGAVESEEPTRAQQVAVRRVAEAKATVPELTVRTDVDVTEALALAVDGVTLDDLVVKASGLALRAMPRANGAYRDGRFERYARVNVGLAVPAGQGQLTLPTIFDADAKPLAQVASEARALVAQVRDGSITAAEVAGGTFTVTTTGGHAVDALEPIIVAPQAAGLGVGAAREAVVPVAGAPAVRKVLTLTLVADARALHGPDAAELLARIASLLAAPAPLAA